MPAPDGHTQLVEQEALAHHLYRQAAVVWPPRHAREASPHLEKDSDKQELVLIYPIYRKANQFMIKCEVMGWFGWVSDSSGTRILSSYIT